MNDSPDHENREHAPVALFEGPRLAAFRGFRLLALITLCVGAGVALHIGANWWLSRPVGTVMTVGVELLPQAPPSSSQEEGPRR